MGAAGRSEMSDARWRAHDGEETREWSPMRTFVYPSQSRRRRAMRGQSFVELALVLPLILVIVAAAADLGRLFTAWVGLNNTARIAANYAAGVPDGPFTPGSAYERTVLKDATTINCTIPTPMPTPVFTPDNSVGSEAKVEMVCTFRLVTPILGSIVGDQLTLTSRSIFVVGSGDIPGIPVPPPPPCTTPNLVIPNLVGLTMTDARAAWTAAGFTGSFSPNGSNMKTVTGQIPDVGTCRPPTQSVFVTHT